MKLAIEADAAEKKATGLRYSVSKLEEEKIGLFEEVQFLRNSSIVAS